MDLIKPLIWDNIVQGALRLLFSKLTFLTWGPINGIVLFIVKKFTDKMYELLKELVDLKKIAFKNYDILREYEIASATLAVMAKDHGIDSPEFKSERETFRVHFSKLVRIAPEEKVKSVGQANPLKFVFLNLL